MNRGTAASPNIADCATSIFAGPSRNASPGNLKVATNVRIDPPIAIIASIVGHTVAVIALSNGAAAQSPQDEAPTACHMRLASDRAVFKPLGELGGPAGCGGPAVIFLGRIILADRTVVPVQPPAPLPCQTAEASLSFVRQGMAPAPAALGARVR